jgi:hypothetical protein
MAQADDDQWRDLLAGENVRDAEAGAKKQAEALRSAVLSDHQAIDADVDVDAAVAKFEARLARERPLRREGQGEGESARPLGFFDRWVAFFGAPQLALAFALVLALGVVVRFAFQAPADFVARDYTLGERNYVKVDDPKAHHSKLATELQALGIKVETLPGPDIHGALVVQATLPVEADGRILRVLERHGLRGFRGGELDVGFQQR